MHDFEQEFGQKYVPRSAKEVKKKEKQVFDLGRYAREKMGYKSESRPTDTSKKRTIPENTPEIKALEEGGKRRKAESAPGSQQKKRRVGMEWYISSLLNKIETCEYDTEYSNEYCPDTMNNTPPADLEEVRNDWGHINSVLRKPSPRGMTNKPDLISSKINMILNAPKTKTININFFDNKNNSHILAVTVPARHVKKNQNFLKNGKRPAKIKIAKIIQSV